MANTITDGIYSTARAVSPLIRIAPIPGLAIDYISQQDFEIDFTDFDRLELNDIHPTLPDFFLVEETTPQPSGNGVARWTRVYAAVPETHDEYVSFNYTFIGFYGAFGVNALEISGRGRFTRTVTSRIQHDYFLVGAGGSHATAADIPVIQEQQYFLNGDESLKLDYLADAPPFITASDPTRTEYETMITNEDEIVAQGSELSRWHGNIWLRQTRYVTAQ